ncbi:MAG: hypothetical protein ABI882_07380 [Acidobacteriota bacterium]
MSEWAAISPVYLHIRTIEWTAEMSLRILTQSNRSDATYFRGIYVHGSHIQRYSGCPSDGAPKRGRAHLREFTLSDERYYQITDYRGSDSTKSARRFDGLKHTGQAEIEDPGELTKLAGVFNFDNHQNFEVKSL